MNGPLRQGIHPAGGIAQSQNSMLGLGNPPFMQTPPHMGQPSLSQGIGVPQNINPTNPPMGMLSGGPVPQSVQQRYPMQPNSFLPHQSQQQRPAILRQGQNPPQLNPSLNPPSGHVQNFHFPGGLMPSQVPNNALRRVPSQPLPNSLAHQGLTTPAGANVAMMNIQPNMPGQMRQTQHPNPQNVRMQPQQQPLIQAEMRNQPMNPGLPQNMNRNPSQGQVMNSLAQPPIIGSMQHPTAMQPPHLQNPFPNNGPMQSQHPPPHPASPRPTQNNPSMSMGTPGPSHTPVNRPSITPDNSFIGYPSAQFAGTPNRLPSGNQSTYPSFVPSSTPPMPMDVSQTSPALLANRSFSTQPMDIMNSSLDMYNPSLMPPPSSVPHPRPPSHTNPHPSPQQQQQQLQSHHQSPPHTDQPTTHPQRPQSQPQQAPGRPPSQTATRTPRSSHMSLPSGVLSGPLTATGRIPNPQQTPGQLVSSMPTIAPRPPNLISAQQQQQHQQQQQQPPPQTPVNPSVPIPGDVNPAMTAIQRANLAGTCLARLLAFSGMLANDSPKRSQLHFWNELVRDFFTPKAVMKLTLWRDNLRTEAKPFEIGVPILPRFFLVTTQSGVKSMSLSLDGARERPLNPTVLFGHSVVECINAIWTYKYSNGYTVMLKGPLTVHAVVNQINPPGNQPPQYMLKFEEFTFDANTHEKYILLDHILGSRALEAPRAGPPPSSFQPGMPPPPALPPTGPGGPQQQQQQQQQQQMEEDRRCEEPRVLIDHGSIPGEPVNAFGIPQATMRCLELAESVGSMADLISFAKDHNLGPLDALKNYANKIRESSMAMGVPGGPQPIINPLPPSNSSNTSLGPPWSNYPPPSSSSMAAIGHSPAVTLYSSAPPSVTNPPPPLQSGSQSQSQIPSQSQLNPPSSMNSPQNTSSSSSANSPEKQPKTIPQQQQQQQQQQQGQPGQTASTSGSSSGSASGSGSVVGGSGGGSGGGGGPATSPAVSSGGGGTTNNTPAMANTSLKRKQAGGDVVSSPTVGNSEQLPVKKVARRKGRTGTG